MATGWIRSMGALLLVGAALVGGGQALQASGHHSQCTAGQADGRKTCNCSDLDVQVQICHAASVAVTLGSRNFGSFSTGQSTSTCFTVKLPPERCAWIRYHFQCCPALFGWNCTHTSNSIHSSSAGSGDC